MKNTEHQTMSIFPEPLPKTLWIVDGDGDTPHKKNAYQQNKFVLATAMETLDPPSASLILVLCPSYTHVYGSKGYFL
jgi:hypothetical protein